VKEVGKQQQKMDEPWLLVLSVAMFLGSYLAGCLPLLFTLNEVVFYLNVKFI
jgi:hypothetical protein